MNGMEELLNAYLCYDKNLGCSVLRFNHENAPYIQEVKVKRTEKDFYRRSNSGYFVGDVVFCQNTKDKYEIVKL